MLATRFRSETTAGRLDVSPEGRVEAALVRALVANDSQALLAWATTHSLSDAAANWLVDQGLGPWAFYHLRRVGALKNSTAATDPLRNAYYSAAAYEAVLASTLCELLSEFAPLDIRPVVLKGMALCGTIYPAPGLRPISDIDLLIGPHQVDLVKQVLLRQHYRDAMGLETPVQLTFPNHLTMDRVYGAEQRVSVEAHWLLVHDPAYARIMDADGMRTRARWANLHGCQALVLEPQDQLLHACAHLLLHHSHEPRLIWLLDLRLLVGRYGTEWDWEQLTARANTLHLAGALRYLLNLAADWFGPFLPTQATLALSGVEPSMEEAWHISHAQAGGQRAWDRAWQRMRSVGDLQSQIRYVRESFFPPWAYLQYRYGARFRLLAPYYYGRRIVRAFYLMLRH